MHRSVHPKMREAMDQSLALLRDAAEESIWHYERQHPNNSPLELVKGDVRSFERELRQCIEDHVFMPFQNGWFDEVK